MTEERNKILEMLAAGKISADDAARLLDKLGAAPANTAAASARAAEQPTGTGRRPATCESCSRSQTTITSTFGSLSRSRARALD